MPYMYLLRCSDGTTYVGSTWDLERRLGEHQLGLGGAYTSKRLPVELAYCEEFERWMRPGAGRSRSRTGRALNARR